MVNTIPIGFGFHPSDEELLCYYLEKMNQGIDSEITAIIPVINVCDHEPNEMPALIRKAVRETKWSAMAESMKMRYFCSRRDYKYTNKINGRSNRTTGGGFYKITGKVQVIKTPVSKDVIGKKRILTHYKNEVLKSKTDWVLHEYYQTDADSGEQIGEFVLCCLKNKSDDHYISKDADLSSLEDADPSSGSSSMASTVDQAASASDGVVIGEQGNLGLHQSKVDDNKDDDDDDEAEYGGCGSFKLSDFEDAPDDKFTEAEITLKYKELEKELQDPPGKEEIPKGSTTDSYSIDENGFPNCLEDQTESCNSPDVDMIQELHNEPENLGSVLGMPRSPQPQPHQQQDYPSGILQTPMSTKRGNVLPTTDIHKDEFRKRKCPEDDDPSLAKKNKITTNEFASNTTCSSGFVAGTPEGYSQPGGAVSSDTIIEAIQGLVNCISLIGAMLQCCE